MAERTTLARAIIADTLSEISTAVAVVPRQDMRTFFVNLFIGGSDGIRYRRCVISKAISILPKRQIGEELARPVAVPIRHSAARN